MEGCKYIEEWGKLGVLINYQSKVLDPPLMGGWDQRIRDQNSKVG